GNGGADERGGVGRDEKIGGEADNGSGDQRGEGAGAVAGFPVETGGDGPNRAGDHGTGEEEDVEEIVEAREADDPCEKREDDDGGGRHFSGARFGGLREEFLAQNVFGEDVGGRGEKAVDAGGEGSENDDEDDETADGSENLAGDDGADHVWAGDV